MAIADDYAVVVAGVERLLEPFADRVKVVELVANRVPEGPIDVALFDAFAQGQADNEDLRALLDHDSIRRVVVYTWDFTPTLVETARRRGIGGYLSKALTGAELADAIEQVHQGEFVLSAAPPNRGRQEGRGDWPGRPHGLTERESEVLALLTQGCDTRRIAEIMHLSQNSIKTYSKSLYRKIDVHTRSEAILWGIDHGFRPDHYWERDPGN